MRLNAWLVRFSGAGNWVASQAQINGCPVKDSRSQTCSVGRSKYWLRENRLFQLRWICFTAGIEVPSTPQADGLAVRQNPTARMSGESNSDVDDFYPGSPYCGEPSVLSFTNLFA
jgi:hypothetical protein